MYTEQTDTHTHTHDGLLQSQALNMVTFSVAKQKCVLYFIETFLTQYLSYTMSENKGILRNSQLMVV